MMRSVGRGAIVAGALALLSGCASSDDRVLTETQGGANINVLPANYRAEILAYQRSYLNDPTGIRGAMISPPALKAVGKSTERYVVCVRFDAKNPNGAYSGVRDHLAIFQAGKLDQMGVTREQCRDAAYEPFPELERMTR